MRFTFSVRGSDRILLVFGVFRAGEIPSSHVTFSARSLRGLVIITFVLEKSGHTTHGMGCVLTKMAPFMYRGRRGDDHAKFKLAVMKVWNGWSQISRGVVLLVCVGGFKQ